MKKSESIINQSSKLIQNLHIKRLFHIIVTVEIVLLIIIIQQLTIGSNEEAYYLILAMLVFSSIFYFLKVGKYQLGTNTLILLSTLFITFFMWKFNGLKDEAILLYPVVLIFTVILGNEKFLVAILSFTVTNILIIAYVNVEGIYVNSTPNVTMAMAVLISIILALSTFSVWLLSSTIRKSLMQIEKENKRVLESKVEIQELLDNEKKLRATELELHKLQKIENIGVLAGGIAHDFNNLLTSVYGNLSLARMKLDKDHPIQKYLETSESSIDRATQLTKQLLTFSKGGEPILEEVNLTSLIHETVLFDLSGSNVKAEFYFPEEEVEVNLDKSQIQQVISNLIINAKQATPDGGTVQISVSSTVLNEEDIKGLAAGNYIKVTISDEGIGIDKNHVDKIFDPYFTTKSAGNGLGLSVVYSIIKQHQGLIKVDTEVDKGTSFIFYLPKYHSSDKRNLPKISVKEATIGINKNILVMDDDLDLLTLLRNTLEHHNFSVSTVPEGNELLKCYTSTLKTETPFDAVILDLTIPGGMGGRETMERLLEIDPTVKCIVSSGYTEDDVISDYKKYGFKASISKPFILEELVSVLTSVLAEE